MRFPTPHLERIKILDVHDGDTVYVYSDRARDQYENLAIRLQGVFAPELRQVGGPECRAYVLAWFGANGDGSDWPFMLETIRTPRSDKDEMTLSRYLGIIRAANGRVLNDDVQAFVDSNGYGGGIGDSSG